MRVLVTIPTPAEVLQGMLRGNLGEGLQEKLGEGAPAVAAAGRGSGGSLRVRSEQGLGELLVVRLPEEQRGPRLAVLVGGVGLRLAPFGVGLQKERRNLETVKPGNRESRVEAGGRVSCRT